MRRPIFSKKRTLLILAIGYLPNIGGLETHLKDLVEELVKRNWKVVVLTYQPLNTPVLGNWKEKEESLTVFRLPVLRGVFYKLLKFPLLEFLFLEPLLFLAVPLVLLRYPEIAVVNAQGIIAGFAASFWTKIFRKRYVVSVQSVYNFPKKGLYRQACRWIFNSADKVIAISDQAKDAIETLGVGKRRIIVYTNWENKENYQLINKSKAKSKIGFEGKFIVSFFGRLVEEKGVNVLLEAIRSSKPQITFLIYGEGPLKRKVEQVVGQYDNTHYMGIVTPYQLSLHYSAADLVVMPSLHEEGFGRVASGALFCGTPVIASSRGALPEVVNNKVGRIINPTPLEIAKAVNFYFVNRETLKKCAHNARPYALSKFSKKNAEKIINTYI